MKTHKDLDVWRASVDLARDVYIVTKSFPKEEQFGLIAQMRRGAVSIASNIAEGAARQSTKEFVHFLLVAVGSSSELDTQMDIAKVTEMCDPTQLEEVQESLTRVTMMLRGLIRSLKSNQA